MKHNVYVFKFLYPYVSSNEDFDYDIVKLIIFLFGIIDVNIRSKK